MTRPLRIAVALVSVVIIAWLVVLERDVRLLRRANVPLTPGGPARTARDVASALRGSRLLNPDTAPQVGLVLYYNGRGQWRRAIAEAERVVREEPDNATAWTALLSASQRHDPRHEAQALAALRRLDPLDARGG